MCPDLRFCDGMEPKLASNYTRNTIINALSGDDGSDVFGDLRPGPNAKADTKSVAPKAGTGVQGPAMPLIGDGSPSDASLAQLALAALKGQPLVAADKVRSVVRNAWLILEGEVDARIQRQAAEDAVKGLPGIRGISNNILIESEVMAQRVSRKIEEAFVRNARLSANRISVTASNQKIILSGSVRSGPEREEAEAAAWAVKGVSHVVNRIRAIA